MSEPTPRKRHYVQAVVTGNALALSNEKKTPSVKIQMQAIPDRNPVEDGVALAPDRILWADLWLSEAAFASSLETLETVFGWRGMSIQELNEPILVGTEVSCACSWEEGQDGKWREKVDFLNPPGGGMGVKRLDEAAAHDVVSRVDALMQRVRQNAPGGRQIKPPAKAAAQQGARPSMAPDPMGAPAPRGRQSVDEDFYA